jgi:hypothetical protein
MLIATAIEEYVCLDCIHVFLGKNSRLLSSEARLLSSLAKDRNERPSGCSLGSSELHTVNQVCWLLKTLKEWLIRPAGL